MAIEIDDEDGRGRVQLDDAVVEQILGKNVCLPLAGDPTCFWPYTNYNMKSSLDFSQAYRLRSTISDFFHASDGRLLVQKAFGNQVEKWLRASGAPHFWTKKHIALQVYGLRACMSQMRYAKIRNTKIPVKYEQLGAIFAMTRVPNTFLKSTDLKGLEDDDGDVELLDDDDVSVVSVSDEELDFMIADRAVHESLAKHEIAEPDNLDELLERLFATPSKTTGAAASISGLVGDDDGCEIRGGELIAARPTPSGCEGPTPEKNCPRPPASSVRMSWMHCWPAALAWLLRRLCNGPRSSRTTRRRERARRGKARGERHPRSRRLRSRRQRPLSRPES